jgi:hypothetical protein
MKMMMVAQQTAGWILKLAIAACFLLAAIGAAAQGGACAVVSGGISLSVSPTTANIASLSLTSLNSFPTLTVTVITNEPDNRPTNPLAIWAYFGNTSPALAGPYDSIQPSALLANGGTFSATDPWGDTQAFRLFANNVNKHCTTTTQTLLLQIDMTKVTPAPAAQTFTGTLYLRAQLN